MNSWLTEPIRFSPASRSSRVECPMARGDLLLPIALIYPPPRTESRASRRRSAHSFLTAEVSVDRPAGHADRERASVLAESVPNGRLLRRCGTPLLPRILPAKVL